MGVPPNPIIARQAQPTVPGVRQGVRGWRLPFLVEVGHGGLPGWDAVGRVRTLVEVGLMIQSHNSCDE